MADQDIRGSHFHLKGLPYILEQRLAHHHNLTLKKRPQLVEMFYHNCMDGNQNLEYNFPYTETSTSPEQTEERCLVKDTVAPETVSHYLS